MCQHYNNNNFQDYRFTRGPTSFQQLYKPLDTLVSTKLQFWELVGTWEVSVIFLDFRGCVRSWYFLPTFGYDQWLVKPSLISVTVSVCCRGERRVVSGGMPPATPARCCPAGRLPPPPQLSDFWSPARRDRRGQEGGQQRVGGVVAGGTVGREAGSGKRAAAIGGGHRVICIRRRAGSGAASGENAGMLSGTK
ncbi:hypothetical protein GGX14DRAFT_405832 [Mycena pura]|uniref:Uncharacterized protein n=1 Tax=Mycena pura TaxID=153505 RepID=A0AAD6UT56_9AGAR|nr:hypothetical protein GGX14DRAFT_405832 [Mycena pura]